jgi:hypothetical protein
LVLVELLARPRVALEVQEVHLLLGHFYPPQVVVVVQVRVRVLRMLMSPALEEQVPVGI